MDAWAKAWALRLATSYEAFDLLHHMKPLMKSNTVRWFPVKKHPKYAEVFRSLNSSTILEP